MAMVVRANGFFAGLSAGVVGLACLIWAPYLLMYADFGATSFWDGYCSSNEPWFAAVAIGTGVIGIALVLYASWRAIRLSRTGRPGRAWLFVVVAVAMGVGWAQGVTAIEPQTRSLPASACGYG